MRNLIFSLIILFIGSCTVRGNTNRAAGVTPQEAYQKGKAYFLSRNYSDALTWAKKAADGEYCPAYVLMAEIYESAGSSVDDPSQARYYYSLAAGCASKNTRDYWFSCWRLGYFYENGRGNVNQDLSKALYYYQQARANTISTNYSLFDSEIARIKQNLATTPEVEALQQSDDGRSVVMRNKDFTYFHKIVSIEGFISGGQKKYMVFANYENSDPNTVWVVNMVPKNNKNTERPLPEVLELIYHDLGSAKKNFCSVRICYTPEKNANGGYGWLIKDERIPDEIANKLVELLTGRSGYIDKTGIRFSTTNSAALQPDKKASRL